MRNELRGVEKMACHAGLKAFYPRWLERGQAGFTESQGSQRRNAEETAKSSRAQVQATRRPRDVAKASGIPKSMIETSGVAFEQALRARRSFQERR